MYVSRDSVNYNPYSPGPYGDLGDSPDELDSIVKGAGIGNTYGSLKSSGTASGSGGGSASAAGAGAGAAAGMSPWAIGALIGAGKAALIDAPEHKKDMANRIMAMRLAPWTKVNPWSIPVKEADIFNSAVAGARVGDEFGANKSQAELNKQLIKSQIAKNQADAMATQLAPTESVAPMQVQAPKYRLGDYSYVNPFGGL